MPSADLVMEGGGVKGAALAGAVSALASAGYDFPRCAGTSSGALVAALVAAGMAPDALHATLRDTSFEAFLDDANPALGWLKHLGTTGKAVGEVGELILDDALYKGDALHRWLTDTLAGLGVRTWGDLRVEDPASSLPPDSRYRLVVIVSDVSRGKLLRLPWDYQPLLGVDPDPLPVAQAVLASCAIPFFFRPVRFAGSSAVVPSGSITTVDGTILSDFPVWIFDRTDGEPARWPTFGIKLSARPELAQEIARPARNAVQMAIDIIATMYSAHDAMYIDQPSVQQRTIFVDTTGISATDFAITPAQKELLYQNGYAAAQAFLASSPPSVLAE